MKIEKVLVTGGAGFIGNWVVENLVSKGKQVTILDHNPRDRTNIYPPGVNIFCGDVRDEAAVLSAVMQNDGVIHLAAILGTQETIKNPSPVADVNVFGALNVFKAVRQYERRAVYICVGNHWMNNPYSITKTAAERFAFMFNKNEGTKIAAVRGMNVFGPRQKNLPVRKMMPNTIINALKGEDLIVYGDGKQIMDWIFVPDMAEILVRALLMDHEVYNKPFEAGLAENTTVIEVVELVKKMTNSNSKIVFKEMRPGEDPNSIVKANPETWNLDKLWLSKNDLTSLEKGLEQTIAYYQHNIEKMQINKLFA